MSTPLQHQLDMIQRAGHYERLLVEIANEPMVMKLILIQNGQLWADIIEATAEFSDDESTETELALHAQTALSEQAGEVQDG